MTANAMKADLDACLAAGMNDHVTKPIDRKTLVATLRRWVPVRRAPETPPVAVADTRGEATAAASLAQAAPSADAALPGIDVSGTLQRLGIDRASLDRMLLRFADGQGPLLEALRAAVDAGDGASAARHAHAIAGAAGNLGADQLRAAAKALEQAGRDGGSDLTALLADVEERAAVVARSIETLRPQADRAADASTAPFDRDAAGDALDRLTAALNDFDLSSANTALADLGRSGPPSWAATDLARLRACVEGYEYDEARGIASRLLGRVRGADA
jgi:two-component system sensor histidine kinase/response regulator